MTTLGQYQEAQQKLARVALRNGLKCLHLLIEELRDNWVEDTKKNPVLRNKLLKLRPLPLEQVQQKIKEMKAEATLFVEGEVKP